MEAFCASPQTLRALSTEQAGGFLRVRVRQASQRPYDWRTQITHPQIRLSALRGRASFALRPDRRDRPDNMRIHVDFKHYFGLGPPQTPQCTADDIEQKWENAGRVGRL
jgi:hypothetical protein